MPSDCTPARKRQFQPTIDSFFARNELRSISNASIDLDYQPLGAPALPDEVQSSLFSVGMRVRKAVPEGYKTHKTALFADTTVPSLSAPQITSTTRKISSELTPFCGLHKVGGLAVQSMPVPIPSQFSSQRFEHSLPIDVFSGSFDESLGSLPSTQESVMHEADAPVLPTASKRRFEDGDEEEEDVTFLDNTMASPLFSTASFGLGISGFGQPLHNSSTPARQQRAFAKPHSKAKAKKVTFSENIRMSADSDPMDFGEAAFLDQQHATDLVDDIGYI